MTYKISCTDVHCPERDGLPCKFDPRKTLISKAAKEVESLYCKFQKNGLISSESIDN